jgi:hypothetical protein
MKGQPDIFRLSSLIAGLHTKPPSPLRRALYQLPNNTTLSFLGPEMSTLPSHIPTRREENLRGRHSAQHKLAIVVET